MVDEVDKTTVSEPDKLDDKKAKAGKTASVKQKEDKKKDTKGLSEEEKKVADRAIDKKISKEDAKKEVAREEVKSRTGHSAEAMAEVGRTVLHANDSLGKESGKAANDLGQVKGNAVEGMLEKMTDSKVAKKIVQSGLGSEFMSTGEGGLEQGARTVLEKSKQLGEAAGMEAMLAEAVIYGKGMTMDELKKLTPDKLKEMVDQAKQNQVGTPDKDGRVPADGLAKQWEKLPKLGRPIPTVPLNQKVEPPRLPGSVIQKPQQHTKVDMNKVRLPERGASK